MMVAFLCLAAGCGAKDDGSQVPGHRFDHGYSSYEELLSRYVKDGLVNYLELKVNRQVLDTLVDQIASADLSTATSDQKLVFYINGYNILILRSIIDAYPVESIRDIDGVWDGKKWTVAGDKLTLNEIEHKVLRKKFAEPRIHFAIVCASIGCPPLRSQPYNADSLEIQLASAARHFATNPQYNRIDPVSGSAQLSSIFDWFGDDFVDAYYNATASRSYSKKENAALSFLISQFPDEDRRALELTEYDISYMEYGWSLNDMK
jgi:hypothetical protein